MEHIVQFAINFDDRRITEMVEENAQREIIDDLRQKVIDGLYKRGYYGLHGDPKNGFSSFMEHKVDNFLAECKDEIIEMAGRYLAERLIRTKAARELLHKNGSDSP